ncbi:hypothetical protein LQ948_17245 [Jiella sp. MQZ9-1]|uniref:Uncharacterized protein n=1 Tax=Jiella flava TaxID=2816857 RepID=A0A939JW22_9HYPH|nr:hypothetical protein [Jiella flava]MBO0662587.1 hypothetical protein [Jiella flava]MCD2472958.1 hypothetical protein [Jiella flava]
MVRKFSLGLIGLLIVACYAVPYGMLGDVASWKGAFLFWTLAGLLVIGLNAAATAGFGGEDR